MKKILWIVLAAWIAGDAILEKKNKQLWEKVQLPANIFCSAMSLGLMVMVAVGVSEVVFSRAEPGSKVLFFAFGVACISALLWGNVSTWRRWREMKKAGGS